MGGTTGIRVIALTTGLLLYQRSYAGASVSVLSSRDGRYLSEQISTVDDHGQVAAAFTMIRRTLDGRTVARLDRRRLLRVSWGGMAGVDAPLFTGHGLTLPAV